MERQKQKKQGLGFWFVLSFIILLAILCALIGQTAMLTRKAKADTKTVYKLHSDVFAEDFKWTTYSYKQVISISPKLESGVSETQLKNNLLNNYGISYGKLVDYIDTGTKRIFVDNTIGTLTIDWSKCRYNFDLVEVRLSNNTSTSDMVVGFYSVVAYKTGENTNATTVINFNDLDIQGSFVLDINFYKVGALNDGSSSWNVNLYTTADVSETKLYSETFIPKGDYCLMNSAYMESTSYNLGYALGAYYGTIDALNLAESPSYTLSSAGFGSTSQYDEVLWGYNTNYSRYNTAYKTLISANSELDYRGTNLYKYYGYEEQVTETPTSSSTEPSTSEEPSTSTEPSTSEEPSTSNSTSESTSTEPSTSEEPPTSEQPPKEDNAYNVTVVDYDDNIIGSLDINANDTISFESVSSFWVNGECPADWEYVDLKDLATLSFKFGETKVPEYNITIRPREVRVNLCNNDGYTVENFDIPYNSALDIEELNKKSNTVTDKYMFRTSPDLPFCVYTGQNLTYYRVHVRPLCHDYRINVIDNNGAEKTITKGVIGNGTAFNYEYIKSMIPTEYKDYVLNCITINDLEKFTSIDYDASIDTTLNSNQPMSIDIDLRESEKEVPEQPDNSTDEPSTSTEEPDTSKKPGISGDEPMKADHKHDFNGKDWIKFRCRQCGISWWKTLWLSVQYAVYIGLGILAVIFVIWVISKVRGN